MRAGDYRTPIIIAQPVDSKDADDQPTQTYQEFCKTRARIFEQSSRQFVAAKQIHSELTEMLGIRYRPGVTAVMQVQYGGQTFSIIGQPIDVENRHRELILQCAEVS